MALLYIHIIHIFNIFLARLWIIKSTSKEFSAAYLNWITTSMVQIFLYLQNYKRACDIFNVYKLYKVKTRKSSWRSYSLRERVGLEDRVVLGSDLIPLQYVFKDLVNV